MKALVGAFNQEKALVGAFSVIVQPVVEPMELYTALVLGGEDVAGAPGDLGPQLQQRLDEHRGLDGHVKTARDPGAGQRLLGTVDLPEVHQTGHLVLGKGELLAAPVSQGDVSYKGYMVNIGSNDMCHEV